MSIVTVIFSNSPKTSATTPRTLRHAYSHARQICSRPRHYVVGQNRERTPCPTPHSSPPLFWGSTFSHTLPKPRVTPRVEACDEVGKVISTPKLLIAAKHAGGVKRVSHCPLHALHLLPGWHFPMSIRYVLSSLHGRRVTCEVQNQPTKAGKRAAKHMNTGTPNILLERWRGWLDERWRRF